MAVRSRGMARSARRGRAGWAEVAPGMMGRAVESTVACMRIARCVKEVGAPPGCGTGHMLSGRPGQSGN